jgi:hypothetical protein
LQLRVDENQSHCGLNDFVSEKVDNWIRENSKFFNVRTGSESVESNIFNAPSGGEYSMRADLNETLEGKMLGETEMISGKARQKIMDLIGDIQVLNGMYREQAKVLRYLKEDNAG